MVNPIDVKKLENARIGERVLGEVPIKQDLEWCRIGLFMPDGSQREFIARKRKRSVIDRLLRRESGMTWVRVG